MDFSITMASETLNKLRSKIESNLKELIPNKSARILLVSNLKTHKTVFGVVAIVKDKTTTVESTRYIF